MNASLLNVSQNNNITLNNNIFIIIMITYHDASAKANHYLDDADLPVVITLHGRFSQGWYLGATREFRNQR